MEGAPAGHSYFGIVSSADEAHAILEASKQGLLPRVTRRLTDDERLRFVRAGAVFVWEEEEASIRRWTDQIKWSPSRVSGAFLTYTEVPARGDDTLIKQSFSSMDAKGIKMHLIAYQSKAAFSEGNLPTAARDPLLQQIIAQRTGRGDPNREGSVPPRESTLATGSSSSNAPWMYPNPQLPPQAQPQPQSYTSTPPSSSSAGHLGPPYPYPFTLSHVGLPSPQPIPGPSSRQAFTRDSFDRSASSSVPDLHSPPPHSASSVDRERPRSSTSDISRHRSSFASYHTPPIPDSSDSTFPEYQAPSPSSSYSSSSSSPSVATASMQRWPFAYSVPPPPLSASRSDREEYLMREEAPPATARPSTSQRESTGLHHQLPALHLVDDSYRQGQPAFRGVDEGAEAGEPSVIGPRGAEDERQLRLLGRNI